MKIWIARTSDNGLYLFITKPFWREDLKLWCEWRKWTTESDTLTCGYIFNSYLFPEVTFENSPMKVELIIKKKEQA